MTRPRRCICFWPVSASDLGMLLIRQQMKGEWKISMDTKFDMSERSKQTDNQNQLIDQSKEYLSSLMNALTGRAFYVCLRANGFA